MLCIDLGTEQDPMPFSVTASLSPGGGAPIVTGNGIDIDNSTAGTFTFDTATKPEVLVNGMCMSGGNPTFGIGHTVQAPGTVDITVMPVNDDPVIITSTGGTLTFDSLGCP